MSRQEIRAALAHLVVLAAPFMATSLWLCIVVAPFGMTRMLLGVLYGLMLALSILLIGRRLGRKGSLPGVILYVLALALCAGDAVSWFMQGSSFNERFFVHVNTDNIRVSLEAYPWAMVGAFLGLAGLMAGAGFIMGRIARRGAPRWVWVPALLLLAISLEIDASPHRLYAYFANAERTQDLVSSDVGSHIRGMIDTQPTRSDEVAAKPGRNLVFVYLESLERTYTDDKRFPGLTPEINRLRRQGLDFSGFQTFPGITYTISGIFSSQCGAPYLINSIFGDDFGKLGFVPSNDHTSAASFHPHLACLGDILHAAGYDQTYLSGVALGFANTDVFFRMHGYSHALGKPEIEQRHGGKLVTEGWGLLDGDIYQEALDEYRHKQASGKPFSVVFSTIDTHPPEGYLLPGCQPYTAIRNDMLDAIHCGDKLLGQFIDKLSQEPDWKNTVVVVMSDHVSMRNVASPLYPPDDQRQPLLFILNAGQGDRPARMYHMDIAPTVLALLGVHSNVRFMAGNDRGEPSSASSPLPANDVAKAVLRDALWEGRRPPEICAGDTLVRWDGDAGLEVGGWKLPLMLGGFPVDRIADTKTLMIFVSKHNAELQMLARGEESPWLLRARKQGGSVFQVTPFRNDRGESALALDWLAPQGGWASLGEVSTLQDIHLQSPQCKEMVQSVDAATPGKRLDFSAAFSTRAVPAAKEHRPGFVMSSDVPSDAPPTRTTEFMFARIAGEQAGFGTVHVNQKQRITIMPSRTRPATAEFDVSGLSSLRLVPRIDNQFGACVRRKDTGIVGVQLSLDDQPAMPRFIVDRHYAQVIDIPTSGKHVLRIDVDKGNMISDCDYFAVGFADIVAETPGAVSIIPARTAPN